MKYLLGVAQLDKLFIYFSNRVNIFVVLKCPKIFEMRERQNNCSLNIRLMLKV